MYSSQDKQVYSGLKMLLMICNLMDNLQYFFIAPKITIKLTLPLLNSQNGLRFMNLCITICSTFFMSKKQCNHIPKRDSVEILS